MKLHLPPPLIPKIGKGGGGVDMLERCMWNTRPYFAQDLGRDPPNGRVRAISREV